MLGARPGEGARAAMTIMGATSRTGTGGRAPKLAGVAVALAALGCVTTPYGRQQLELYPEAQLESQASALYAEMRSTLPMAASGSQLETVVCVTTAVTEALPPGSPTNWEVTLFEDDTPNAFALPGARIGVHTGLLRVARNQDQLAAVIGHEVAHVLERHANARASNATAAGLLVVVGTEVLAGAGGSSDQQVVAQALGLGAQVGALMPFSRSHESVADWFGLEIMADAGFDPRESVALWRNMEAESEGQPVEWLSTHPSHGTRIEDLTARIPAAYARYERARESGRRPDCN